MMNCSFYFIQCRSSHEPLSLFGIFKHGLYRLMRGPHTHKHTHIEKCKNTHSLPPTGLISWPGVEDYFGSTDTTPGWTASAVSFVGGPRARKRFPQTVAQCVFFVLTRWSTHDRPAQPRLWHGATGRFVSFWNVINREFTRSRDHAARLCGRVPDLQLLKNFANNPDTLTCGALESWLAKWVCFLLIQLKSDSCGDQGGVIQVGELLWSASVLRHSNKNYQSIFYN